jgi:hypothetical protein
MMMVTNILPKQAFRYTPGTLKVPGESHPLLSSPGTSKSAGSVVKVLWLSPHHLIDDVVISKAWLNHAQFCHEDQADWLKC